jgi:paraquat-inducible protein B
MNRPINPQKTLDSLPRAKIKKSHFSWLVWGFPVAAAVFLAFLVGRDLHDNAHLVIVTFKNTDGVEAGNTLVKCHGAMVGTVKHIEVGSDHESVIVGLVLKADQASMAREGALFWVVRPQIGVGMVSGLQTVMSGSYIEMRAGTGAPTNHFIGSEDAPPPQPPGHSLQITLLAPNLSSLQNQSPIYYRGVEAGHVVDFQLGPDSQEVVIHALILEDYAPLVRKNSVFWNAGGIDFRFNLLHGLSLSADSAKALVSGAIEFATPDNFGEPANNGTSFRLFEKPAEEWKNWRPMIPLQVGHATQDKSISPPNLSGAALVK